MGFIVTQRPKRLGLFLTLQAELLRARRPLTDLVEPAADLDLGPSLFPLSDSISRHRSTPFERPCRLLQPTSAQYIHHIPDPRDIVAMASRLSLSSGSSSEIMASSPRL